MSKVSIVTITQYSRFECIKNLYEIIRRQDYKEIVEWIIVEGSQNIDLRIKNVRQIEDFISNIISDEITTYLIKPDKSFLLSDLRNIGNDAVQGDIIICMDDDDYYQPIYVSHAVTMFNKYNRLISGCSSIYIYDYLLDKLYKCKGFHNNHTTNNCMAYKRKYLENHRYKSGLSMAEESSFTEKFSEPMIQLNPEKCIIVSGHINNTIDKQGFVINNPDVIEIKDKQILDMIPKDIYDNMKRIFSL